MADGVVQKFSFLTQKERLNALQKLIFALNVEERDFASEIISQRTDPTYILPVELVLHTFNHLSLFNMWTLQRVSRHWQKTLSSEDFIRSAVSRWHSEDQSDTANDTSLDVSIQSKIQHMQAVELSIPISEKVFDNTGTGLQGPQPKLSQRKFDFKGRKIAYISSHQGQGDAVIVRDLVTGDVKRLRGEARERILLVVLTTALVGFVTFEGCLYVLRFTPDAPSDALLKVRLPSSGIQAAGGDCQIIAMVLEERPNTRRAGSILVYDAASGHLQNSTLWDHPPVYVGNMRPLHSCSVIVDSNQGTVDVFFLQIQIMLGNNRTKSEKILEIEHSRNSVDGQRLHRRSWKSYINFETTVRDFQFLMVPPCPTGRKDEYRITICEVPFMGGLPFRFKTSVRFNSQEGDFLEEDDPLAGIPFQDRNTAMTVFWKKQQHRPHIPKNWFEYIFYMNDTFMVSLEVSKLFTQHSRIRVLCFDPDVNMEGSKQITQDAGVD